MASKQISLGWISKNSLDRHRPAFLAAEVCLFIIGALFWADTATGSVAFASEVFGDFAYSLPARLWAFAMMGPSAMLIVGLMKPIKNWMVWGGAFLHCIHFVLLSYSAVFTGGSFVIGLFASLYFLPLHLWIFLEAVGRAE